MSEQITDNNTDQNTARLRILAEEVCQRENCRLYDLELVGRGTDRILRVFLDKTEADYKKEEQNKRPLVTVDDCANVSQGLSLQLDVEDLIPGGNYSLEVSSPGLDRQLTQKWHFETVAGSTVRVWLKRSLLEIVEIEGEAPTAWTKKKQLESVLLNISEEKITLRADGHDVQIPFEEISKARAVVELDNDNRSELKKKRPIQKKKR